MRSLGVLSLALASFGISVSAAQADEMMERFFTERYVSVLLGLNMLSDIETDTDYSTDTDAYRETYDQSTGYAFRAAVGSRLRERVRGEIEFGVNTSDSGTIHEVINGTATTNYSGSGDLATYTALANLWFDLEVPDNASGATPYVGGGVGVAYVDSDLQYSNFPVYGPQDTSWEFAAQLGAGVNWALNETTTFGVGYRATFVNGPSIRQQTSAGGEITSYEFDDLISHVVGFTLTRKLD